MAHTKKMSYGKKGYGCAKKGKKMSYRKSRKASGKK